MNQPVEIRVLGRVPYGDTFDAMREQNKSRSADTPDQLWLLEHPPVFTQGLAGKPEHLLAPGNIPVVKIDRGGQVTYHGPGQLVIYLLLDVRRLGFGVKELVRRIEQSIIDLLVSYGIDGFRQSGMPGVYVNLPGPTGLQPSNDVAKIAAIGLRVANHGTYHGLSLNVGMDLEPFDRINPCGYEGLAVTQLAAFGVSDNVEVVGNKLAVHLKEHLYG